MMLNANRPFNSQLKTCLKRGQHLHSPTKQETVPIHILMSNPQLPTFQDKNNLLTRRVEDEDSPDEYHDAPGDTMEVDESPHRGDTVATDDGVSEPVLSDTSKSSKENPKSGLQYTDDTHRAIVRFFEDEWKKVWKEKDNNLSHYTPKSRNSMQSTGGTRQPISAAISSSGQPACSKSQQQQFVAAINSPAATGSSSTTITTAIGSHPTDCSSNTGTTTISSSSASDTLPPPTLETRSSESAAIDITFGTVDSPTSNFGSALSSPPGSSNSSSTIDFGTFRGSPVTAVGTGASIVITSSATAVVSSVAAAAASAATVTSTSTTTIGATGSGAFSAATAASISSSSTITGSPRNRPSVVLISSSSSSNSANITTAVSSSSSSTSTSFSTTSSAVVPAPEQAGGSRTNPSLPSHSRGLLDNHKAVLS